MLGAVSGASDDRGRKWAIGSYGGVDWNPATGFHKEVGIELRRHVGSIDLYGSVSRDDGGNYGARAGLLYNF